MGVFRRRGQKSTWPPPYPPRPGINEGGAIDLTVAPQPSNPITYGLDLDIGEVADGHHLIVRSISLTEQRLLFGFAYVPEVPEERRGELWPNMSYGADVCPRGWNQACADAEWYERPVPEARYAWFDFFRPDYVWMGHFDRHGQPDSDYLRNRIARLTFDMKTGEARIHAGDAPHAPVPADQTGVDRHDNCTQPRWWRLDARRRGGHAGEPVLRHRDRPGVGGR